MQISAKPSRDEYGYLYVTQNNTNIIVTWMYIYEIPTYAYIIHVIYGFG